jgi:hypothetical protein
MRRLLGNAVSLAAECAPYVVFIIGAASGVFLAFVGLMTLLGVK